MVTNTGLNAFYPSMNAQHVTGIRNKSMMAFHHAVSVFFFMVVLYYGAVSGDLLSIRDQCCQIGKDWHGQSRHRCPSYPSNVLDIPSTEQSNCRALVHICCLHERKHNQCLIGKTHAKQRGTCDGLRNQLGKEDSSECCHCCKVGLIARSQRLPCTILDNFSPQCSGAFRECCAPNDNVTPVVNVTTTSSPPTTTSRQQPGEIDLCTKFSGMLCAHVCVTTPGSYYCTCRSGFTLHTDGRSCLQDTAGNQCDLANPCQHLCIDTGISVHCQCFEGYQLDADVQTCNDIDECDEGTHTCVTPQTCVNTPGSFACEGPAASDDCTAGFAYNTITGECDDIDECIINQFSCSIGQVCVNSLGSYMCQSPDTGDEYDVDDSEYEDNDDDSDFNCGTGFRYNKVSHRCEDINECDFGHHKCTKLHQNCRNTIGSHTCICDSGFQYNPRTFICEDINECAQGTDACIQGQQCENTDGSYICRRSVSCGTGYTLDRKSQTCVDDDECSLGTHNCGPARDCQNTQGSFRCAAKDCGQGRRLDYRTGQCVVVICPRGLKADREGNCIDVNECTEDTNICRTNQRCHNTIGSFVCRNMLNCGPGFELNSAGNQCQDVDECRLGTSDCVKPLMECINRPGTYICQCPDGYQMNHSVRECEDINECERYGSNVCSLNAECHNTPGSYRCVCKEGFQTRDEGRACRDVDECSQTGICQHSCRNTWGSYQCTCYDGYQLSADGRTCQDIDECDVWSQRGGQLCVGLCENTLGSYQCSCPEGYNMMSDSRTCQDIDECSLRTANCNSPDDICVNTRGGYKCQAVKCPNGFVKAIGTSSRSNNVKCQRQTFVCPQGDIDCLYAPLSYTTNFITFPSHIRVPADLFTMRGPPSRYRRMEFDLKLVSARDAYTGETRASRSFFKLNSLRDNEAVVQLLREIEGPQDIELQLDMNIYSKEFRENSEEIFFGTAVAKIFIYVTNEPW